MKYTKNPLTPEALQVDSEAPPVLTHSALGTFQDAKTGKWLLAKIRYNPETKETGEFEAIGNEEGGRDAINYRLKIAIVKEGILT